MKEISSRFAAIFLVGLLLIKISAFHVYQHDHISDESNSHCELCVLTIEGQQNEGTVPLILDMYRTSTPVHSQPRFTSFEQVHVDFFQIGMLFSRPPPHTPKQQWKT